MDWEPRVAAFCELERPLYAVSQNSTDNPEEPLTLPNPAIQRRLIWNAKTKRDKEKLIWEWAVTTGLFSNMEDSEKDLFIDLRERYRE